MKQLGGNTNYTPALSCCVWGIFLFLILHLEQCNLMSAWEEHTTNPASQFCCI